MNVAAIASSTQPAPADLTQFDRAAKPQAEQAKAAAAQFEAILIRQFLNESVGNMLGNGKGPEGNVYGYLLTDTLAQSLTAGGGLGLGKVLQQQLSPRPSIPAATVTP
jgi:flagellar protein FlgJ